MTERQKGSDPTQAQNLNRGKEDVWPGYRYRPKKTEANIIEETERGRSK